MKDIVGYEGIYAITKEGNVWSYRSQKWLKSSDDGHGYLKVGLYKDGKFKTYKIHRLIAEAFIENPNNLPCINHKDENTLNNSIDNLEWCTHKYNMTYGTAIARASQKKKKPIYCIELNKRFDSLITAAKELNLSVGNIGRCLTGRRKTIGGYHFKYCEE